MKSAELRSDEVESMAALRDLAVLDTASEAEFQAFAELAAKVLDAPIALVSLIDHDRQWFKANVGLAGCTETSREVAFCAHAVLSDDVMEVADAREDPRFTDNPLVVGDPDIRFYAGAPITVKGGFRVGTVCVIDRVPRQLAAAQRRVLQHLAVAAGRALEGRAAALKVDTSSRELLEREAALRREQQLRHQIEEHAAKLDALLHERTEMLDVLAHEVRQPLNNASAALQSAQAALQGMSDNLAQHQLVRAQAVLGQVLTGIDNTLAVAALLAGPEPIQRTDTDVDTLVALTLGDMPERERCRVEIHRDTSTRTALMDMSLMRLALRNVVSNALRFSPPGAAVQVRLADSDEPLALLIDVKDSGPGIPPALLPALFTRGARGRDGKAGHGLGLYIVARVMSLHGGDVEVFSTGPEGATLRLVINQSGIDD